MENQMMIDHEMILPKYDITKKLYIVPTLTTDYQQAMEQDSIIVSTNPTTKEERDLSNPDMYDLSSFLDRVNYMKFIEYLIESRNITDIEVIDSIYGYQMIGELKEKYPKIKIHYNEEIKELLYTQDQFEEEVIRYYKEKFDIDITKPFPKNPKLHRKIKRWIERMHAKKEWC